MAINPAMIGSDELKRREMIVDMRIVIIPA